MGIVAGTLRKATQCEFLVLLIMLVVNGCGSEKLVESPSADDEKASTAVGSLAASERLGDGERLKFDRAAELRRSDALSKKGDFTGANEALRRVLLENPDDVETLFRLANVQAAMGRLAEAITLLDSIPAEHPEAGLPAMGQAADWCMESEQYGEAEKRYLKLIERVPDAVMPRRKLAHLYNRQGRRHEAADQILYLCRLGDVRQDELHSLMSLSDAVFDDEDEQATANDDLRPLMLPIGAAAHARIAFTKRKYADAVSLLRTQISKSEVPPTLNAFYGRALAEAQHESELVAWLMRADGSTKQCAEYWAAVGVYLVGQLRFKEAVRALGEALKRDNTDLRSYQRMNQSLVALGEDEAAKRWFDRYVIVRETTILCNQIGQKATPDLEPFPAMIDGLLKLDRPLEAVMWQFVEALYKEAPSQRTAELAAQHALLLNADPSIDASSKLLCGLNLDSYPLPTLKDLNESMITADVDTEFVPALLPKPRFKNVAENMGLNHEYLVASERIGKGFAIYQSLGGGLAVLDYDLDGTCDLYLAQGGCDPPKFIGNQSNVLFRATDGLFRDVTDVAGASDYRYGIGISSGDWNQDGFPDLVVANLGQNSLLVNNGDGSFTLTPTDPLDDPTVMSTSVAMGDVSGDGVPDIVELNYLEDASLAKKPTTNAKGELEAVRPLDYNPGMARVLINDEGERIAMPISKLNSARASGLGIVISDFDGVAGNEIFIGNDMRPDQLWRLDKDNPSTPSWLDMAPLVGCALGNGGTTTASMGIAAADFDNSGTLDLYITNFENEPSSFFLNRGQMFQDRSVQYKLVEDSLPVLGFGCQPIDYNNDGLNDLIVTNGHVEDTGVKEQMFAQPAQLFVNQSSDFQLASPEDSSGYFGSKHVGRGLATLDINRDGRMDFVVTHIEEPTALLINQTETAHQAIRIRLVGTRSERDAIGAKVSVRVGSREWTQWAIAGDGYLCKNESTLHFGIGDSKGADEVTVIWPTGNRQVFKGVTTEGCNLLVEGDDEVFNIGYPKI
jgi:tetratricopeptide (TPR) repeat protein